MAGPLRACQGGMQPGLPASRQTCNLPSPASWTTELRWADTDRVLGLCLRHLSAKRLRQRQDRESTLRCQAWPGPSPWLRPFLKRMAAPFLHTSNVSGTLKYISV